MSLSVSTNPPGILVPWTVSPKPGQIGYVVQRSTDGTTFSTIALVDVSQRSYLDMNVVDKVKYYYRVGAFYSNQLSNVASIVYTAPAPPLPTESPDNTTSTTVTDKNGNVYTLGTGTQLNQTLQNGTWIGKGMGTMYLYLSHIVYVLGTDNNWYQLSGTSWTLVGPTKPGTPPPVIPDVPPNAPGKPSILP